MSELGVGLIGCGNMGRSLGKQLVTVDAARLLGVTDVSAEAAREAAGQLGAPAVPDLEALLALPGLDAVIIASPPFEHRRLAERAAAAGKHVFVEKPLAASTADCDAIIAAAADAGVTLMVGQVLRYYPCWWKVLELVRAGEIGAPVGITVTRIGGGWGSWTAPWRHSLELSGGLLMEVNAHEIDFMCEVGGEVTRVYAEADRYGDDPSDYPNLYFMSLRFAGGAVGLLHSSNYSHLPDLSGKVQGTEGTLFYHSGFGGGEIRYARHGGEPREIPIAEIQLENPVRKELRLFVEAVQSGGPSPIPGAAGRRNVAIAEAAYASARSGQSVLLG